MKPFTKNGDALAFELTQFIGYSPVIRRICAMLVRHANRLHNLYVIECNGNFWQLRANDEFNETLRQVYLANARELQDKLDAEADKHIRQIHSLVFELPDHDEGRWHVEIEGDPRGKVVTLIGPNGKEICVERGRLS